MKMNSCCLMIVHERGSLFMLRVEIGFKARIMMYLKRLLWWMTTIKHTMILMLNILLISIISNITLSYQILSWINKLTGSTFTIH